MGVLRYKLLSGLILALVFSWLLAGYGESPGRKSANNYNPNEVVFSLKNADSLAEVLAGYHLELRRQLLVPGTYVGVTSGEDASQLSRRMLADTRISSAEPNLILRANPTNFGLDGTNFSFDVSSIIPGTTLTSTAAYAIAQSQWAWQKIDLAGAPAQSKGAGVTVAVLDTGVNYNHQDLKGRVLKGYDATNGVTDGNDVNGHGTFVAGIILQIAPQATILPVRVLDSSGYGTLDAVLNGLQFAVNQKVEIANLSFSTDTDSSILHLAVQNARLKGTSVVCSAGNDGTTDHYYPASYTETVGVSATDLNDFRPSFANYSSYIQLSAPGVAIYSTYSRGGYGWANGTSFSTPMVVGGMVILKSLHPAYSPDYLKAWIKIAVDRFPSGCNCAGLGSGRLNLSKLK